MRPILALVAAALACAWPLGAHAKLPPLSPEAQVKADEAKAKAAWTDKVAAFQLCRSMERVADTYRTRAKAAGKETRPAMETPPCTDPGAFVAAAAPAPAPAAAKPIEASGAHSPPATATTPPSASPATQTQLQGAKK